jgi:serine/threonine protein kinase
MIELAPGTVFAGYRLEALAGRGGMGVVYRATELALDRTVAIKVMAPWLVEDETARRRFIREARLAASIEHANVIPIHAAGEHDGLAYIVMRFVDGSDLRALIVSRSPSSSSATIDCAPSPSRYSRYGAVRRSASIRACSSRGVALWSSSGERATRQPYRRVARLSI